MRDIRFFTLIWMILLGSCGIIESQNKIVSVDSKPRGAKAFYQKKELGPTPLLQELGKSESGNYTFQYPTAKNKWKFSKTQEKNKQICGYHGDKTFLPIDKIEKEKISGKDVVNTFDPTGMLFRGKKFECVEVVRAKIPEVKKIPRKICNTYLVIPPESGHSKFSQDLSKAWREKNFDKHKSTCDKIILPAQSEEALLFLGIDHLRSPRDLPEMRYKNIFALSKKFKATHLVFLPYKSDGDKRTVTPKIYDIHKGKVDPDTPNKKYTANLKMSGFSNFLFSTFRFIPNAVGLGVRLRNRLWGRGPNDEEISKVYDKATFGVGIGNIQYPQKEWMLGTLIAPSLVFAHWGRDVDINTFGLTLNLNLFLHLPPGGVVAFRVGGGGAYMKAKSDIYNFNSNFWSYLGAMGLEFYFFPLKRFYMSVGYRAFAFDPAKIQFAGYQVTSESHAFLEIGYFFPELRMLARKLL